MTETTRTGFGSGMGALGAKLTALAPARRIADPRPGPAVPDPLPPDEFELISVDVGDIWMSRRDEVMRPYMQRARTWEPEEGRLLRSSRRDAGSSTSVPTSGTSPFSWGRPRLA